MATERTWFIDIHSSLLRLCTQLATSISAATGTEAKGVLFDAYADDETLPPGDFVGLTGLSVETDGQLLEGTFMIGFSTQTDKNLFRLVKGVNAIFSALEPGKQVEVVSAANGFSIGGLAITDGTKAMPVSGRAGRPVQLVAASFQAPVSFRLPH